MMRRRRRRIDDLFERGVECCCYSIVREKCGCEKTRLA
jgi:hypothetical protein